MQTQIIREIIEYYRGQGAPQDQQMLIALMREAQEEAGGVLSQIKFIDQLRQHFDHQAVAAARAEAGNGRGQ